MEEHLLYTEGVGGSSPSSPTIVWQVIPGASEPPVFSFPGGLGRLADRPLAAPDAAGKNRRGGLPGRGLTAYCLRGIITRAKDAWRCGPVAQLV